eukprot:scaffold7537_cov179-Ochromonas_danica.AAC.23
MRDSIGFNPLLNCETIEGSRENSTAMNHRVIAIDGGGRNTSYAIVLFGTILVGLAQPFYLNMPAKIAATWFGVKERDIATTMASLGNPLGSAIGSLLPPMLVSQDSDHSIEIGIRNFRPNTPASASAEQMQIMASTLPASIVACVECSYPVSEEVCVGLMYMGANVFAIACTFGGQQHQYSSFKAVILDSNKMLNTFSMKLDLQR